MKIELIAYPSYLEDLFYDQGIETLDRKQMTRIVELFEKKLSTAYPDCEIDCTLSYERTTETTKLYISDYSETGEYSDDINLHYIESHIDDMWDEMIGDLTIDDISDATH